MCFFLSLMPATVWAVVGYFVLFASTRVQGATKTFGKVLAIWIFIIAVFIPLGGAYVTLAGLCPIEGLMQTLHSQSALRG